jgi:hypothetical protein
MVYRLPLQAFYQRMGSSTRSDCLEQSVQALFAHQPFQLDELIEERTLWQAPLSEEKIYTNWKILLNLTLLGYLSQSSLTALADQLRLFLRQPWNQQSQYMRALVALNHALVGLPIPEVHPQLLENGAALIEIQEYYPWLALPYRPHQAEFGTYLCLLAFLTQRQDLKDVLQKFTNWQLNTLAHDYLPLCGLFVQEREGILHRHLLWNYLLFYGAAKLLGEGCFEHVAQTQLQHLEKLTPQHFPIAPLFLLLEKILEQPVSPPSVLLQLPEQIYDPSTSLVGQRTNQYHAICTLHGGYTGLGAFRVGDVEIVSYGPQYLPLSDCQGFGIEGNFLSDQGARKTHIERSSDHFSLKGCVRLVDQPQSDSSDVYSLRLGQFRGIWFEMEQLVKGRQLELKTQCLGLNGWDGVAFSFFIKAKKCCLSNQVSLTSRTLSRYDGNIQLLTLEGYGSSIVLNALHQVGQLQVIPLGGGDNFWGADFLVAYVLDSSQSHYCWHMMPKSLLPNQD